MQNHIQVTINAGKMGHKQLASGSAEAAGYDIVASEDVILLQNRIQKVSTDLKMVIPKGWVGIIKERSGLAAKGLEVHGGVIDSDYRGEVCVLLKSTESDWSIKVGERIAQIVFVQHGIVEVKMTDVFEGLEPSGRGDKGFGSTGV